MFLLILFINIQLDVLIPFKVLCHLFACFSDANSLQKGEKNKSWMNYETLRQGLKCVLMSYVDLHKILHSSYTNRNSIRLSAFQCNVHKFFQLSFLSSPLVLFESFFVSSHEPSVCDSTLVRLQLSIGPTLLQNHQQAALLIIGCAIFITSRSIICDWSGKKIVQLIIVKKIRRNSLNKRKAWISWTESNYRWSVKSYRWLIPFLSQLYSVVFAKKNVPKAAKPKRYQRYNLICNCQIQMRLMNCCERIFLLLSLCPTFPLT